MPVLLKIWLYRAILFILLFGISPLSYGGEQEHPLFVMVFNLVALAGMTLVMAFYFTYPVSYKAVAWLVTLGSIFLVLESLHSYQEYVYSFFVLKRFSYCGLALITFYAMSQLRVLKLNHIVNLIFFFYVINQLVIGRIFSYSFTSETRTTSAPEALYLVIPFLHFLVTYLKEPKKIILLKALTTFALIVILLHRSVMSTAVITALILGGLSIRKRVLIGDLKFGQTLAVFAILLVVSTPFLGALSPTKTAAFFENIAGIFSPTEDETGSWRYEQSLYYWDGIQERPLLGWRYDGYDKGEIMENEDFPTKGTIIHSHYVDLLYNYGLIGLGIHLLVICFTLLFIYYRNETFSTEQTVLFCFIAGGLLFGISYQLPAYYWSFVGLGMYYGSIRPIPTDDEADFEAIDFPDSEQRNADKSIILTER
ncbi:hypothetical protein GCM10027299_03090 [Larkinella ripae]